MLSARPNVRDVTHRDRRVGWLSRTATTYGWLLHAYLLMGNHDHVFVETPEAKLSAEIKSRESPRRRWRDRDMAESRQCVWQRSIARQGRARRRPELSSKQGDLPIAVRIPCVWALYFGCSRSL